MMIWLTEPLGYAFFVRGLIAAALVGAICGLIGVYIVLRKMSYIGHGLSHAVFGGAVVSYLLSWNFYLGAGTWGFLSALLINGISRKKKIGADAAIGIVTTASFALGVALISRVRRFTKNFEAALFGNILGVSPFDLWVIAGVVIGSALLIALLYKPLLFATFDSEVAPVYGVRVDRIDNLFSLILAAVVIASMQVMGVTMIAAAIVIPAISARMLTDSFHRMVAASTAIGALSGLFGMYLSFHLNISSGATIVLFGTGLFAVAFATGRLRERGYLLRRPARIAEGTAAAQALHAHRHEHGDIAHTHEHHEHLHPGKRHLHPEEAREIRLEVPKMTCDGCASSIRSALAMVAGIDDVKIDVPAKTVRITFHPPASPEAIRDAITRAGF